MSSLVDAFGNQQRQTVERHITDTAGTGNRERESIASSPVWLSIGIGNVSFGLRGAAPHSVHTLRSSVRYSIR